MLLIARDSSHTAFTYSLMQFTNMRTNTYLGGAGLGRPNPAVYLKAEARIDVPGAFRNSLQMICFILYICVRVFYIFIYIDR